MDNNDYQAALRELVDATRAYAEALKRCAMAARTATDGDEAPGATALHEMVSILRPVAVEHPGVAQIFEAVAVEARRTPSKSEVC